MSASPAYSYYPERSYEPASPSIHVVPGRRQAVEPSLNPSFLFLLKTIAVVLVFIAAFAFVRITLSSLSVTAAIESRELNNLIETARAEGAQLEVRQSALASPERIRIQAASMSLINPEATMVIDLSGDIVVTDGEGNLSLSDSLKAAASAMSGATADEGSPDGAADGSGGTQNVRGVGMAEGA